MGCCGGTGWRLMVTYDGVFLVVVVDGGGFRGWNVCGLGGGYLYFGGVFTVGSSVVQSDV